MLPNPSGNGNGWRGLPRRPSYEEIKRLTAETNRTVEHLLAPTVTNDPYYAGAPHRRRDAEWFAQLWEQHFQDGSGFHLRRCHYRLVVLEEPVALPDGTPYLNTDACWTKLQDGAADARHLGLVP